MFRIVNTIFIASTYSCLSKNLFLSLSYPKTQPLARVAAARASKSNLCQRPSHIYMNTIVIPQTTTLRKIPPRVTGWCWDSLAPASRYSQVDKNKTPQRKCGLHGACSIQKANCRHYQQSSATRNRLGYTDQHTYSAQSRVGIRTEMRVVDRILNNM